MRDTRSDKSFFLKIFQLFYGLFQLDWKHPIKRKGYRLRICKISMHKTISRSRKVSRNSVGCLSKIHSLHKSAQRSDFLINNPHPKKIVNVTFADHVPTFDMRNVLTTRDKITSFPTVNWLFWIWEFYNPSPAIYKGI